MNSRISICVSASSSQLVHFDSLWISIVGVENECEILFDVFLNGTDEQNSEYVAKIVRLQKLGHRINFRSRSFGLLGESRNWMIQNAQGEYIFFIDGDDYVIPENFNWLDNELEAELMGAPVIVFRAQTDEEGYIRNWHNSSYPSISYLERKDLLKWFEKNGWRLTSACVKIYNISWLRSNQLEFTEEYFYEDTPFWFDVIEKLDFIHFVHVDIYRYRRWSPSQITGGTGKRIFDIFSIFSLIKAISHSQKETAIKVAFYSFVLEHLVWTANATNKNSLSRKNRDLLQLELNNWIDEAVDYLEEAGVEILRPKLLHSLQNWYQNRYVRHLRYMLSRVKFMLSPSK